MNLREIKVLTILNPPIHEHGILVDLFSSLPCTSFFVVLNLGSYTYFIKFISKSIF